MYLKYNVSSEWYLISSYHLLVHFVYEQNDLITIEQYHFIIL